MPKSTRQVFLSYSHHDRAWVEAFVASLQQQGIDVWFDQQAIRAGDRWQERIQDALRNSSTLIAILGPHNINSPWTFFEFGAAVADGKKIIPVLLDGMDPHDLPIPIAQFQALRATSPKEAGDEVARVVGDSISKE